MASFAVSIASSSLISSSPHLSNNYDRLAPLICFDVVAVVSHRLILNNLKFPSHVSMILNRRHPASAASRIYREKQQEFLKGEIRKFQVLIIKALRNSTLNLFFWNCHTLSTAWYTFGKRTSMASRNINILGSTIR